MAKDQTVFVAADVLKADADALAAIVKMTGYAPVPVEVAAVSASQRLKICV